MAISIPGFKLLSIKEKGFYRPKQINSNKMMTAKPDIKRYKRVTNVNYDGRNKSKII